MTPLDRASPEFAELLGEGICALARYFVGVPMAIPEPGDVINGRSKLDPVYITATEGRDGPKQWEDYSSCGDLLHHIMLRIGVEAKWVNQGANHVYGAKQMTKLQPVHPKNNPGGCPAAVYATPGVAPPPGSLCLIWTTGYDAHALVSLGPGSDIQHLLTANYGASGMRPVASPGADLADSPMLRDATGKLRIGSARRILQTVITPERLIPYMTGPLDLSGAPVSGELVDALGARYDSV